MTWHLPVGCSMLHDAPDSDMMSLGASAPPRYRQLELVNWRLLA